MTTSNGPSRDPVTFVVTTSGDLIPEDIEVVRQEIARALKRLQWERIRFDVDVL